MNTHHTPRVRRWHAVLAALATTLAVQSGAAQSSEGQSPEEEEEASAGMGLAPGAPQTSTLPGGVTPAFGQRSRFAEDWRFDFHGFATMPLRIGFGSREDPAPGQSETTLHAPPRVPGPYGSFGYTSVVPEPWVQLNFSYANPTVMATVIIAAKAASTAQGYFLPPNQLGINDAFLTFNFARGSARFEWNVGAFTNRYGLMGEYDEGRYGTPLVRLEGVGETISGVLDAGALTVHVEHGIMGQIDKAPLGLQPDGWNDNADPAVGASFAHHAHAGLAYQRYVQLGLHYITAWSQDDRATAQMQPDGSISVLGADLRFGLGPFGHLFTGVAHTIVDQARSVGRIISINNARGGPGLRDRYLGTLAGETVDGTLTTVAAQYDLSIAKLMLSPQPFNGSGPDLVVSGFGMMTTVTSALEQFDEKTMFKYGGEVAYSILPWLAASVRYDRVLQDLDNDRETFAVISPRVILRSDFNSQDQVTLQYSHWFNGSEVVVEEGFPPRPDPTIEPDSDMISLTGSMWW